ncbi:chemotaxis regulatory protein ChePep-like [Coccinella septempunctata]|uniref:chemotaxis regulatory protein ChePep-like n=1 Tax=Coccinella septempunctata TaxID=41139 RepID=UPI001D092C20|nr:chemotaxis regulatory protein ChePep-like [Coccinella septempunctata]
MADLKTYDVPQEGRIEIDPESLPAIAGCPTDSGGGGNETPNKKSDTQVNIFRKSTKLKRTPPSRRDESEKSALEMKEAGKSLGDQAVLPVEETGRMGKKKRRRHREGAEIFETAQRLREARQRRMEEEKEDAGKPTKDESREKQKEEMETSEAQKPTEDKTIRGKQIVTSSPKVEQKYVDMGISGQEEIVSPEESLSDWFFDFAVGTNPSKRKRVETPKNLSIKKESLDNLIVNMTEIEEELTKLLNTEAVIKETMMKELKRIRDLITEEIFEAKRIGEQ